MNEWMRGGNRTPCLQDGRDVPNQEAWSMSRLSWLSFFSISGRAMAEKPRLIPEATVLKDATKLTNSWKRNLKWTTDSLEIPSSFLRQSMWGWCWRNSCCCRVSPRISVCSSQLSLQQCLILVPHDGLVGYALISRNWLSSHSICYAIYEICISWRACSC